MLWPRNDIEKIVCLLFSRWKGADHEPFRPVQVMIFLHVEIVLEFRNMFITLALLTLGCYFFCVCLKAKFEFHHGDYEKQFLHAISRKDKAGMVMNNPNQSVFLFLDRQHLQVGCVWRLRLATL